MNDGTEQPGAKMFMHVWRSEPVGDGNATKHSGPVQHNE